MYIFSIFNDRCSNENGYQLIRLNVKRDLTRNLHGIPRQFGFNDS